MKKIIWTITLASIPFCAFLQNNLSDIENDARSYFAALEQRNVDTLLSCLYLEAGAQSTKSVLERIFGDTVLHFEYSNSCVANISEITKVQNVKYAVIFYTSLLEIQVPDRHADFILRNLQGNFGKSNICHDSGKVSIQIIDCMYAAKSDHSKSWKFVPGDLDSDDRNPVPQKVVDKFALRIIDWIAQRI